MIQASSFKLQMAAPLLVSSQPDKMPNLDEIPSPLHTFHFPAEIECEILESTAWSDPSTQPSLLLVSQSARQWYALLGLPKASYYNS